MMKDNNLSESNDFVFNNRITILAYRRQDGANHLVARLTTQLSQSEVTSCMQPIPMDNRCLEAQFSLGPLRIRGANELQLSEVYWLIEDASITFRISANYPTDSPWRGGAMLGFFAYQFPDGKAAFDESIGKYRREAKAKVRLPDKFPFDRTTLAPRLIDESWEHDFFGTGPRDLFHILRSENTGLMIRLFAQRGTVLDNPILSFITRGVTVDDSLWEPKVPTTHQRVRIPTDSSDKHADETPTRKSLDLRESLPTIREFIQKRVASFDPSTNFGPGEGGKEVVAMTLGFSAQQEGWLALVFDCRPEAEIDGEWTKFLDGGNLLSLESWLETYDTIADDRETAIVDSRGELHVIMDHNISDADLNRRFGETIRQAAEELVSGNCFSALPRTAKFRIETEELNGFYTWSLSE